MTTAPPRKKPEQKIPLLSGWNSLEVNKERCMTYCCSDYDNSALITKEDELRIKIQELRDTKAELQLSLNKLDNDLTDAKLNEAEKSGLLLTKRKELADYKLEENRKIANIILNFTEELKKLENTIKKENKDAITLYSESRENDINIIKDEFNSRDNEYKNLLLKLKTNLNTYKNSLNDRNNDYFRLLEEQKNNSEKRLLNIIQERNNKIISEINNLNNSNEAVLSETKQKYDIKIKDITEIYNQSIISINNQKKIIEEEFNSLEQNLLKEVALARKRKDDMQQFYDKEIVIIRNKIAENDKLLLEILDEMNKEFQKRKTIILSGTNFDKEKITSLVDGKIESYVDMYERKKKTVSLDFAQRKQELINNYNKKFKIIQEEISNNINNLQQEKSIIYSELSDINNKYKNFSEDSINELDNLSKVYQENVDKYNLEYNLQKEIFDKELQDEMDKLENERIKTIENHSKEVDEILKGLEEKIIKEEAVFFSTSNKKRLELAKLVKELDEKSTKIIIDKQKNILNNITKIKNNYDNILSEYKTEREELKIKLENAEWDVETNTEDYNKIINDNSIVKIIQENENISNYTLYFFGLTGIILLILVLTKKNKKK